MNWGHKITIGFTVFVIFIIGMVTISMQTDYFLVEQNYYEEEIAFQDKINSQKNGNEWNATISIQELGEFIEISFENAELLQSGNITFFRPSNADLDFSFPITESLKYPTAQMLPGKWIVHLKWQFEDKQYVRQQTLFIKS